MEAWKFAELFYRKFYNDTHRRIFIFGINPGRFGGGVTGIPFTDPIRLENECGIKNDFRKIAELSSSFVYQVVKRLEALICFTATFSLLLYRPLALRKTGST